MIYYLLCNFNHKYVVKYLFYYFIFVFKDKKHINYCLCFYPNIELNICSISKHMKFGFYGCYVQKTRLTEKYQIALKDHPIILLGLFQETNKMKTSPKTILQVLFQVIFLCFLFTNIFKCLQIS